MRHYRWHYWSRWSLTAALCKRRRAIGGMARFCYHIGVIIVNSASFFIYPHFIAAATWLQHNHFVLTRFCLTA